MKKKYLALIMACILCTSVFITGCGRTADVIEEDDEDDDDDDDDDDDKDNDKDDAKDDDKDDKPVYVESIDPATFLQQIKLFVKNKAIWSVDEDSSASIHQVGYAVTDLDHNGRAELIVMTSFGNHSETSSARIFEISESGNRFDEAEWEFSGLSTSDIPCPDLLYYPFPLTYYDEKEGITHYLALDSYDEGDGNSYVFYDDLTYSEGKASSYTYAYGHTYEYYDITTDQLEYDHTYTTDKGDVTESQYYDYRYDYAGGLSKLEECYIGVYNRGLYDDCGVMNLDDEFLSEVLMESYRVFSGYQTYSGFYEMYNDHYAPGDYDETFFERCIGDWKLWSMEIEGDEIRYEEDGPQYATLTITEDYEAVISQYRDGELSLRYALDVYLDDNGHPYFDYDDQSALPEGFKMERYTVAEINSDGDMITLSLEFFGEDGIIGASTLRFVTAQ